MSKMNKKTLVLLFIFTFIFLMGNVNAEGKTLSITGKIEIKNPEELKEDNPELYVKYTKYKEKMILECDKAFGKDNYYYILSKNKKTGTNEYSFINGGSTYSKDFFESKCIDKKNVNESYFYAYFSYSSINFFSKTYFGNEKVVLSNTSNSSYWSYTDFMSSTVFSRYQGQDIFQYMETNLDIYFNNDFLEEETDEKYNFNSITYNNTLYKKGDLFIKNNNITVPIIKPKLLIEEIDHEELNGRYMSKTYQYSFDIYDTTKYRYFMSTNKTDWLELKEFPITSKYEMNMILYFKVTDLANSEISTYYHEINDINRYMKDDSLDISGNGLPDYGDQSSDDALDEDSTISNLLGWFIDLFKKRLGIIFQLKDIYQSWFSFNISYDGDCDIFYDYVDGGYKDYVWRPYCNKLPQLDLSFAGVDKKVDVIDVSLFWKYRLEIFFWIKLGLASVTLYKVIRNVKHAFRGGDS